MSRMSRKPRSYRNHSFDASEYRVHLETISYDRHHGNNESGIRHSVYRGWYGFTNFFLGRWNSEPRLKGIYSRCGVLIFHSAGVGLSITMIVFYFLDLNRIVQRGSHHKKEDFISDEKLRITGRVMGIVTGFLSLFGCLTRGSLFLSYKTRCNWKLCGGNLAFITVFTLFTAAHPAFVDQQDDGSQVTLVKFLVTQGLLIIYWVFSALIAYIEFTRIASAIYDRDQLAEERNRHLRASEIELEYPKYPESSKVRGAPGPPEYAHVTHHYNTRSQTTYTSGSDSDSVKDHPESSSKATKRTKRNRTSSRTTVQETMSSFSP
ncbi:uncharacterized protein V1516DRAFT_676528, partial [Lipomyces oligophaga]|uniref:uncharacterized protein n=1 Tax=Lipomyces oligophaga TaxID=45792 RepID=UPI0034CF64F1